jgi:hypothetical protein
VGHLLKGLGQMSAGWLGTTTALGCTVCAHVLVMFHRNPSVYPWPRFAVLLRLNSTSPPLPLALPCSRQRAI